MLTLDQLRMIAPRAPDDIGVDALDAAMTEFGIDTPLRQAAFLAQLAFECNQFRSFTEFWGPSVDQTRYEPPSVVATRLGNVQAGDGRRFLGRGGIQLTGRANYRACGTALGVDLESQPELAAGPDLRYRVSGWYWKTRDLNGLADGGDVVGITRAINGLGMYGLRQRQENYQRALPALGAVPACSEPGT